ncbi:glycoside hydrolase family 1 protein [Mesoplasma tabanidae]|uniref:6-phospho-beta-glucosidase n=1 Tax=Mesoplasma tabanidae TaxID=219745 RepID=A0A2K8P4J9_9MOLU|nr:glycoside hydrolase family 1 protein [Mesoplasma tabanidae]ATZ21674.1 6-phospho-beta-glucosidase [Mesoplasma tabanidae]
MTKFPKNFLWGASTSAYQIEGAINEGGKVPSIMDRFDEQPSYPEGITGFKEASDHYNKWKEDVALMAEMGFKSYRFSISWPRIIKNLKGDINFEGIKFYNDLIDELLKYNIEPVVTMFHFDTPNFIQEVGGVCTDKFTELFEIYSKVLFENFGSKVKYWLTINELNMFVMAADVIGVVPKDQQLNPWQLMHHLNVAQAKAIKLFRKMCPNGKIGPAPNIGAVYSNSKKPEDYTSKLNIDMVRNWVYLDIVCRGEYSSLFLNAIKKNGLSITITEAEKKLLKESKPDFIAFNYYSTMTSQMPTQKEVHQEKKDQQRGFSIPNFGEAVKNSELPKTEFGWEIDPIGFRNTLREVYDRYQLPVMITENGIGGKEKLEESDKVHDSYRIEYYQQHIKQMGLAIDDGVEMIGYMPWSAIDLVSTHEGISKRYGFVYVNRDEFDLKDMRRIRKDSFFWYKNLIESNGENI